MEWLILGLVFLSFGGMAAFFALLIQHHRHEAIAPPPVAGAVALILAPALAALLIENAERGNLSLTEYLLLTIGLTLVLVSGVVSVTQRKNGSPARWGVLSGALLVVLALALPFIGARIALSNQLTVADTPTPGPTLTTQEIAVDVYRQVIAVIAAETGYEPSVISERLDSGDASVAEIVRETGGDLAQVIQGITTVMNTALEGLAAGERLDANQAAFAISAMETVVRAGVEFDLTNLMSRFEEEITFEE